MEVTRDQQKGKFDLKYSISKYALFLLNAIFAISSVLMVSSGISTYAAFKSIYDDMGDGFRMLSIFWLVFGLVFMLVALFGIFVAFKESTVLANLYGMAMMLVFVSQVAAAIACFTLITRSRHMVSERLDVMMRDYRYGYQLEVDWIQSKFQCCGTNGPSDWQNYDGFSMTAYYYGRTPDYTSTEPPRTALMPASCCERDTNYVNLTCESHHKSGCFEPIHQIVSESIMMIGSSALVLAVVQVLGMVLGFLHARIVRRKQMQCDVHIWNSGQAYSTASPRSSPTYYADS